MDPRALLLIFVSFLMLTTGCEFETARHYRALPVPAAELPVVNPPLEIRQKNWTWGPDNEGSCAHASLISMLNWQNEFDLAKRWKETYGGGEDSKRIRKRLDEFGVKYAYTNDANLALLDYAHATRRGAILWWKPRHCCTFVGWVESSGKTYAVILDNNKIERYEFTERSQFHHLWASYGGFALTVLGDPPSPPIYRSYERIF